MSATEQVWVIEILPPRDDFRSYLAGRDGLEDDLWVEDPVHAIHFLYAAEAEANEGRRLQTLPKELKTRVPGGPRATSLTMNINVPFRAAVPRNFGLLGAFTLKLGR